MSFISGTTKWLISSGKLSDLYVHIEETHNLNAPNVVVPLLMNIMPIRSVLDVGCGTGTWLRVLADKGVTEFLGVDGDHMDLSLLRISKDNFVTKDLRQSFSLGRRFDLVLSLEVAEHLPESSADGFVKTLCEHGDVILFSAAIPGQGGQNHINEQWPAYWQQKFERHGFYFRDVIRPLVWNDERVDWWYRQNIFLVGRQKPAAGEEAKPMIHPALFKLRETSHNQYIQSLKEGRQGLVVSLGIFLNAIVYKVRSLFGAK